MRSFKFALEKPMFIWLLVALVYAGVFWTGLRGQPLTPSEQATREVLTSFAESPFPPRIQVVREVADWGHVGYYAVFGRVLHAVKFNDAMLRGVGLALWLATLLVFLRLGAHFTYRNRLSPLWVSLAMLVLAANPYGWAAATRLGYEGFLALLLLVAMLAFEKSRPGWAAIALSVAVLVDWRALCLAIAFVVSRATGERTRLLRPERMIAFLLPFAAGALPILAWHGVLPQGVARGWWNALKEQGAAVRVDRLLYAMALLPVYSLFFSWAWALRARSRALFLGAVAAAVCIPAYFLFPIQLSAWHELRFSEAAPLGLLDQGAAAVAGQYKNLLLFVPWLAGAVLLAQLLLMDVLERSRWLRYFLILYFAVQPFVIGGGDRDFLIALPAVLLLSLSEALVGEEGKLA